MIIRFDRRYSRGVWEIYVWEESGTSRTPYFLEVRRGETIYAPGSEIKPSGIVIPMHEQNHVVSALLEGLQEAGLMPKMGAVEAELVATKKHLEDIRALAFEEIKPKALL